MPFVRLSGFDARLPYQTTPQRLRPAAEWAGPAAGPSVSCVYYDVVTQSDVHLVWGDLLEAAAGVDGAAVPTGDRGPRELPTYRVDTAAGNLAFELHPDWLGPPPAAAASDEPVCRCDSLTLMAGHAADCAWMAARRRGHPVR